MFLFQISVIHLAPCRVDLLVTCLRLQRTMIGNTLSDFMSSFRIILLNCVQVILDY